MRRSVYTEALYSVHDAAGREEGERQRAANGHVQVDSSEEGNREEAEWKQHRRGRNGVDWLKGAEKGVALAKCAKRRVSHLTATV